MSHEDRKLDWLPRFDERSRAFPIRALIETRPTRKNRRWTPGEILDQGREGACVGFAWTGEALATPVRVELDRVAAPIPRTAHGYARHVYRRAQVIDEWEGENYEGTSVLAGAKVMRENGLVKEYRWCFGIEDVIDALILRGPVVLGTWWLDGMYEAPGGVLTPVGEIVGGHAYLATGYRHSSPKFNGSPSIVIQNSWGTAWGENGIAEIAVPHMDMLLRNNGEACVPSRRSYGR